MTTATTEAYWGAIVDAAIKRRTACDAADEAYEAACLTADRKRRIAYDAADAADEATKQYLKQHCRGE